MKKGEQTKQMILDVGLSMASHSGLESVSIGSLAKATGMSKSGVFAHFESKENLQVEILKYAAGLFSAGVIVPAMKTEAGIPRIKALVNKWISWTERMTGGCIFVSTSTEFSDRPGNVRKTLLGQQEDWLDCLRRIAQSAIRVGDLRKDVDCDQFAFDLYSLLLGFYLYYELLQNSDTKKHQEAALERLLADYQ
ncbi:MAG: TetR/AcrR family transcriptional regulator [Deltaproteobacteria bacterium]|nr:TetR/AcrR family transcriptional regulator [Deltaproteobacteria bacterium]